jgi:monoamine oxidase
MPTIFTALQSHVQKDFLARSPTPIAPHVPTASRVLGVVGKADAAAPATPKLATRRARQRATPPPRGRMSLKHRFRVVRAPTRKIAVVGGGLAGLCAAFELESLGYWVTLFEAQEDVGGRARSTRKVVPGRMIEEGAELIGRNHRAWWSYKYQFKLKFLPVADPETPPIFLDGRRICDRVAVGLGKEMRRAQQLINRAARSVNAHEPWRSRGAKSLDHISLATALNRLPVSRLCRLALREQLQADNGVDVRAQSWLGNLAMIKGGGGARYWKDTETNRCASGSQSLAFEFAKRLKRVRRNNPITTIEVSKNGVLVTPSVGKAKVFDDVVLAIPPSLWRRPPLRILPPLPRLLKVQFGRNVKYLLNVQRGAWAEESPEMTTDGPIDITWEGTDGQPGARAGFVAFSGAKNAIACRSWTPAKKMYLRKLSSVYPTLGINSRNGLLADWIGDVWTRGSYSFPKPGEVTRVGPTLRAGLHGRLHFAGEHTCYAFTGYMEGALQSGLRVATQIASRDRVVRRRRLKPRTRRAIRLN